MSTLLNYPSTLVPGAVRWVFDRPDIVQRSPAGGSLQRQDRLGAKWRLHFDLPPLQGARAVAMRVWLQRATAASVWFQVPDFSYTRQSTPTGTPKVDGASQSGASIALKGFTPGTPDAIKSGDRIGLTTGQVVTVVADANADGSGELTASIDPPLRAAPADDSLVYIDQPLLVCFLPVSKAEGFDQPGDLHAFSFEVEEDITYGAPGVNYGIWTP